MVGGRGIYPPGGVCDKKHANGKAKWDNEMRGIAWTCCRVESRQAEVPSVVRAKYRNPPRHITIADHEWSLICERASYWGVRPAQYLVMCWRIFETSGMPFRLELPLPVRPWDPSKKGDGGD